MTTTETITIYYDEQAGTETGPSGSGPIDGEAADCLTDLVDNGIISEGQSDALADLVDSKGWDRERVILDGVGPLWP